MKGITVYGGIKMRAAICDDEINALKQTSGIVQKVFAEMHLKYSVSEFTDGDELLREKQKYDVVFLDVELKNPDKNGVGVAKELKRQNPACIIIFITNYEEYIDEVIEKYAFRYWSKPLDEYRLRKSIKLIVERMQTITAEVRDTKQRLEIPARDVIYITPKDKHCKIITADSEYILTESFKEIRSRLTTPNFCDCHGSYCVNLNYVEKYTRLTVYMGCGDKKYEVHMSRRHYTSFKEQMFIVGGEKV